MNSGWIFTTKIWKNYIFVGTDEKVIKVYNAKSFELVEELNGHNDCITSIEISDKYLFSGSYDHTIKSWDLFELENRIKERRIMEKEDLYSKNIEALNKDMKKKSKKKENLIEEKKSDIEKLDKKVKQKTKKNRKTKK